MPSFTFPLVLSFFFLSLSSLCAETPAGEGLEGYDVYCMSKLGTVVQKELPPDAVPINVHTQGYGMSGFGSVNPPTVCEAGFSIGFTSSRFTVCLFTSLWHKQS